MFVYLKCKKMFLVLFLFFLKIVYKRVSPEFLWELNLAIILKFGTGISDSEVGIFKICLLWLLDCYRSGWEIDGIFKPTSFWGQNREKLFLEIMIHIGLFLFLDLDETFGLGNIIYIISSSHFSKFSLAQGQKYGAPNKNQTH